MLAAPTCFRCGAVRPGGDVTLLDQGQSAPTHMPTPPRRRIPGWLWLPVVLGAALFCWSLFVLVRPLLGPDPTPLGRAYSPAAGPHIRITWQTNIGGVLTGRVENTGAAPTGTLRLVVYGDRATYSSGFYAGEQRQVVGSCPIRNSDENGPLLPGDRGTVALSGVSQFELDGARVLQCPPGEQDEDACTSVPLESSIEPLIR